MDYKEKYIAALERAKEYHDDGGAPLILEVIFPELKESEDELIRKAIKSGIKHLETQLGYDAVDGVDILNIYSWLEKQGEQTHAALNRLKVTSGQKLDPKFKVGDWIIFNENHNSAYQVDRIDNYRYYLRHYLGGTLSVPCNSELIRLWTIQDAKDGDVLACNEEILLFKSYSIQGRISLYYWYNGQTNNFHSKEVDETSLTTRNKIYPATKEQRELLFQKMKEAGYEWDAKNKILWKTR